MNFINSYWLVCWIIIGVIEFLICIFDNQCEPGWKIWWVTYAFLIGALVKIVFF